MIRRGIGGKSFRDMSQQNETGLGRNFYVYVAGKTNGAHHAIVENLRSVGQVEVYCEADCDYLLLICPIASRVQTDITEALRRIQCNKPVILVVMHHTFNPDNVVAESRRQVQHPNVLLTVDFFFYQQKLLNNCNRNDISWHEIQEFLHIPFSRKSWLKGVWKILVIGGVTVIVVGIAVIVINIVHAKNQ